MRNVVAISQIYYYDRHDGHDDDDVDVRVDFDWNHAVHVAHAVDIHDYYYEYCYCWDGMDESMYSFVYHVH